MATECFFERPRAMHTQHGELYGVLRDFYRQDPAQWLPDATVSPTPRRLSQTSERRGTRRELAARRRRRTRLAMLRSRNPDTWFHLSVTYLSERRYGLAARGHSCHGSGPGGR